MRKAAPLAVEVPGPERDKPAWVKVGVIAAVGFVIGVAWPRLVGVRLGPSAPGEAAALASASSAASARAPEPSAAIVIKPAVSAASAPASSAVADGPAAPPAGSLSARGSAAQLPTITIPKGSVQSCRTADGATKKGHKECGALSSLDGVVLPRLRKLATCAGAEGQTGKLAVVVTADFDTKKLGHDVKKSSTVGNLDALGACVKSSLEGASIGNLAHEHARYSVSYGVTFGLPGLAKDAVATVEPQEPAPGVKEPRGLRGAKSDEKTEAAPPSAPGEAIVGWEVALVRDVPKTGGVVARLPRGTKVKVGAVKDGWYAVKYGEGFASEGFVYRGAIGR